MSKISREDNKKRYKTGMYPTQQDFENVFDSYVHKDDTIDPSKIVSGNENIVDIINRKAEEKHSHEIKDVDGLEKFITEMTSLLEIVRDPETGEISQSKLKTLTAGIAALRDDIDTNTDNIAGHETRITNNTAALEKVYQILGKDAKESIDDLANRFAALSGNYANVYAFVNKVKQFLEDADASDETINRWQEIEAFLQGVTDTQTLTGLLEQQRTDLEGRIAEAIAAIPKGNYLKLVPDLDAYTDAPDGEIVKYTGKTNDKYTHGLDYERKAGDAMVLPIYTPGIKIENTELAKVGIQPGVYYKITDTQDPVIQNCIFCFSKIIDENNKVVGYLPTPNSQTKGPIVGEYCIYNKQLLRITEVSSPGSVFGYNSTVTLEDGTVISHVHQGLGNSTPTEASSWEIFANGEGERVYCFRGYNWSITPIVHRDGIYYAIGLVDNDGVISSNTQITIGTPSTWQLCPASPVIQ